LNKSKGKFELNKETVRKILKSQEVMEAARKEAAKLGDIETEYIGTQRVWIKGTAR
jgi:hypothetical protein